MATNPVLATLISNIEMEIESTEQQLRADALVVMDRLQRMLDEMADGLAIRTVNTPGQTALKIELGVAERQAKYAELRRLQFLAKQMEEGK